MSFAIMNNNSNSTTLTSSSSTYQLASRVKSKLTKEASKSNINLRVLVCQANLLDNLIDHLNKEKQTQAHVTWEQDKTSTQKNNSGNGSYSITSSTISFENIDIADSQNSKDLKITTNEIIDDESDDEYSDEYSDDEEFGSNLDSEEDEEEEFDSESESDSEYSYDSDDEDSYYLYSEDELDLSNPTNNDDLSSADMSVESQDSMSSNNSQELPLLSHCSSSSSIEEEDYHHESLHSPNSPSELLQLSKELSQSHAPQELDLGITSHTDDDSPTNKFMLYHNNYMITA